MEEMTEQFREFLRNKHEKLSEQWFECIIRTYPKDTTVFLKKEKNRFMNPVGYTLSSELGILVQELTGSMDEAVMSASLNSIIKIRAVQDFTPAQALRFIPDFKRIIADSVRNESVELACEAGLEIINARLDQMVLLAFDLYMKCREKIYEVKSLEARNVTFKLLERMNRIDQKRKEKE